MKKLIKYTLIGALATMLTSCNNFLNINTDPSVPQKVSATTVLPPVLAQMVRGEAFDTRLFGRYAQMFAINGVDSWERYGYIVGSDTGGEKWRSHYYSIGLNIDLMIQDATTTNSNDIIGAAKAIRAWSWQSSADVYGEMILKQAWEPNRYIFDFDTQEDVYAEVVRLSNEAIADLDKGGTPRLKAGDLVYGGDIAKWKKFIYGNLARNANHLSNKSTYKPDDVIKFCDLALATNTDNFAVPHAGITADDGNFFGPRRANLADYRASSMIVRLLDTTTFKVRDPRLSVMIPPCPDSIWRGLTILTSDVNNAAGNVRRIPNIWGATPGSTLTALAANTGFTTSGRWIFQDAAPHYVMTAAEIQFIKAEAAFRKGDKPMALAAYRKGMDLHMEFCGITAANRTAHLATVVGRTEATLTMSDIMQQKYIALWGHGALEAWMDIRRFKYDPQIFTTLYIPTLAQFFPDNGGKFAYRARPRYNSEYVWNREALNKFGGNNADYHTYETWNIK